ncbi:MAG: rhodanese-like domain-containing protein [Nitrospirae bacterium]|nr:rhodanese-like domain-containing protein [Nitrospirota bacterium]
MIKRLSAIAVLLLLTVAYAGAADLGMMNAEELKKTMDAKKQVTVVDARTEKEFRDGHIPMALNIPPEKVGSIGTLLPKDKKSLIVFYCRGTG